MDTRNTRRGFTQIKNSVIPNLIWNLQRLPLQLINCRRGRSRIKYGMTPLFNNGAFTLIELLVVVLIIGILAAVAVPQYQKAVEKSRMTEAIQVLHTLHHACQLHRLAGNDYCGGLLEVADITLPGTPFTENCYDEQCINTKDWQYVDQTGGDYLARRLINGDYENAPYMLYIQVDDRNGGGHIWCFNETDSSFCQKICGDETCQID